VTHFVFFFYCLELFVFSQTHRSKESLTLSKLWW